ncbi:hypothetical protein G7Y41_07655 [Schaalia sp. ZJ405]|uniref:hypothetical protein n=1 Tax=unclassified Schaalia TaxID=2691889 RepID=UPI0013EAFEEC|nr:MULTISPECIES: hypothetical protein [unclassified Schaalia]QPK80915.1 hypothetical protein G7Y41_07655 [Schaalia sp. ZJ405]
MSVLAVAAAVVFFICSFVFGVIAARARSGSLMRGSRLGLRKKELRVSDEAWTKGHRAAWPILAMGAAVCLFHGLGVLIAGLLMGTDGVAFLQVLTVSGVFMACALWIVASAAAVSAVSRR